MVAHSGCSHRDIMDWLGKSRYEAFSSKGRNWLQKCIIDCCEHSHEILLSDSWNYLDLQNEPNILFNMI